MIWIARQRPLTVYLLLFAFALSAAAVSSAIAQDKEKEKAEEKAEEKPVADPDIKAMLERLDLKFEVDDDADYRLVIEVGEEERTHVMFIESAKTEYRDIAVRRVWAVGYKAPENTKRIPSPVLRFLMEQSGDVIVGSWGVRNFGDLEVAVFTVRITGDLSDDEWRSVLLAVVETADEAEEELTDKDDL